MGLLSKQVKQRWSNRNKTYYTMKGYKYTKNYDEFLVNVEDLPDKSHVLINVECDNCSKKIENLKWLNYKKYVKGDEKYFCRKCVERLFLGGQNKLTNEEIGNRIDNMLGWELINIKRMENKTYVDLIDNEGYLYYDCWFNGINSKYKPRFVDKSNPCSIQNIKLWLKLNNRSFELLSDIYSGTKEKLKWKCLKEECGEIFEASWDNIVQGNECSFCAGRQVGISNCLATLRPNIALEWHPTKNGDLTPYDVTCGTHKYTWWKCNECGYEWSTMVSNKIKSNGGCPKCNQSNGEKAVVKILHNKIDYIIQYPFEDCKYKQVLPFDFYLPDYNICIEYQGIQHYEPVDFAGKGEEWALREFKDNQIRDQIKRDYCKDNNIKLIEIPYWDFENIEEILTNIILMS